MKMNTIVFYLCIFSLLGCSFEYAKERTATTHEDKAHRLKGGRKFSLAQHADVQESAVLTQPEPSIEQVAQEEAKSEVAEQKTMELRAADALVDEDEEDGGDDDDITEENEPEDESATTHDDEVVSEGAGFVVQQREEAKPIIDKSQEATIEFQFEDADLTNLVKQIAELYQVTFITDDMVQPLPSQGKALKGNKISFRTQKPLTKKQAWSLFQTFLDIAGFAVIPQSDPSIYRIVKVETGRKLALPTFIGVKSETLPDSDQLVRYVYFVQNSHVTTLKSIIDELRSSASTFVILQELNAFVLTDKSYNIKSLMNIVTELDKLTLPQAMSVLKLKRANAQDVKALYESIVKTDEKNITARLTSARKQPTTLYFPENVRIIAEPRTNVLVLLGPQDSIKKIEDFVSSYIDVDIGKIHSPLRVYALKYADANTIASIMNDMTQFGKDTPAGRVGGVRDGDKYLKPMFFQPELTTNRLIIQGEDDDYQRAVEVIRLLDEPQPQVAIEVLILSINIADVRNLGTQIRSAQPGIDGLVGPNVKYQTSGSRIASVTGSGIVTNNTGPGVVRLLGNLISLATGAIPGNTLISLGSDKFGIWGIFNVLQTLTSTQVISNPFLVATNKQQAVVSVGEKRRVISATVAGATGDINSFTNDEANLSVTITPQINSDGMIVLGLTIKIDQFINQLDLSSATKSTKLVKTKTIVADKEVLALGGLIKNRISNSTSKLPILANIPIIGWLFKNKIKTQDKDNLLILISSRIIQPAVPGYMTSFTNERVKEYIQDRAVGEDESDHLDPVHRFFFAEKKGTTEGIIDDFLIKRNEAELQKEELLAGKKRAQQGRKKKQSRAEKRQERRLKRSREEQATKVADNTPAPMLPVAARVVPPPQRHEETKSATNVAQTSRSALRTKVERKRPSLINHFDQGEESRA